MSFRSVIKATLAGLAIMLTVVGSLLFIQTRDAGRLRAGWQRNLPVDAWQIVDGGGSPAMVGVAGGRSVGLYKGATGELLWRYALDLNATGRAVKAVGISADGRTIAAADLSNRIRIFDRFANQQGAFMAAQPVAALALSGDGHRLAQIGADGRIILSDLSGASNGSLPAGSRPMSVQLNQTGDQLMIATSKTLESRSADGKNLWSRKVDVKKLSVAANNNAAAVVTASGRVSLYSGSGRLMWTRAPGGSESGFTSVAVAGRGDRVAARNGERLYLFDGLGALINSYSTSKSRADIAFAGAGGILVSGDAGLFTGLEVGQAISRLNLLRETSAWAYPALPGILALMLLSLIMLRRSAEPVVVGEVVEFLKGADDLGKRKAA